MSKLSVKELVKAEKELCDSLILDTDKMDRIMSNYRMKFEQGEFHNYTLNNQILASQQLYMRTEETTELLAPYKRWEKINRNVKKGEKALYILAPIFYEEENSKGEKEQKMYFKRVPVFDLSQTEGEPFEISYVEYNGNIKLKDIIDRTNIPVIDSNKEITRGYTNGEKIWISVHLPDEQRICVFFHELAHYKLHFNKDREEFDTPTKELEAETISYMVSSALGIKNEESGTYIRNWAGTKAHELIKNKGSKLVRTAEEIINELDLRSLIEAKC